MDEKTTRKYNTKHVILTGILTIASWLEMGIFATPLMLPVIILCTDLSAFQVLILYIILASVGALNQGLIFWLVSLDEKYDLNPPEPQPKSFFEMYGQDASIWD